MGRWRNGVPLVLSPHTDKPEPAVPRDRAQRVRLRLARRDHPALLRRRDGLRCPFGAHVRRLNPRGAGVMGTPHSRRIVRRNMPYGPELPDGVTADDGVDRGLVGYFLCGDLETQCEFLQRVWVNNDFAAARPPRHPRADQGQPARRRRDVHDAHRQRLAPSRPRCTGCRTLVTTRGSAYCLLPGIGGLRYLASLHDPKAVDAMITSTTAGAGGPDPHAARAGRPEQVVPGRAARVVGEHQLPDGADARAGPDPAAVGRPVLPAGERRARARARSSRWR